MAAPYVDELALCGACLAGQAAALDVLEQDYFKGLAPMLQRIAGTQDIADEALQRVRRRLLVAENGRPAKLAAFDGRGSLRAWLRVVATREALALLRDERPDRPAGEVALEALAAARDDELAFMREGYREQFRDAFVAALRSLEASERTLLRLHHIDRLSLEQLAAVLAVHRATVARRLARTRDALLERTRTGLVDRLRLAPGDVDSILRLVQSRLDLSVRTMLETDDHER
ncbi:MAG TPA: sigma-70 family RNA polymerase sigma factor [Nannocystaceae bacterium]|nr:sigma-70 family RNA polymerase sigma factor [Nannocystaceae bacterium]